MKRLRVIVVGVGVMGKYHANVYAALPNVDLVAVVDPNPSRRCEAKEAYHCATYPSLEAFLAETTADAASVAAPTSLHYSITQQLLEAGIHTLVEKPVATEVKQARQLAMLSQEKGLVLQVGHITRFFQAVDILNQQVSNPYLIEARRLTPYSRIRDVGVILDLMIHDIDIVLGIISSDIEEISVSGHALNGSPHEDVAAAQIVFANGCIARFLASRVAPDAERSLVVAEANQTLRFDFAKEPHTEIAIFRPLQDEGAVSHVVVDRRVVADENPLRKELEHFLARIHHQAHPIGTLEDDLRSLDLAMRLQAQISDRNKSKIHIPH
ncbi:MAG: Gfo/Idh/MocA family oxidoreductase [Trueperaceae bacterium]|nr:MAG: Gfo/Idh/MocA family oxidoreductase [Trueperaceae bacterium]